MLRSYLVQLTSALGAAYENALNAVYMSGSLATGAFRPGKSDIDVLVAVDQAHRSAIDEVVATCSHDALPVPATKLELVVYEVSALAAPGERPRWSLNLNTGSGISHVGFDPSTEPAHWFVLDLAFARRHAKALVGPPADTIIGTIPDAAIERAFEQMVEWYARNEPAGVSAARARAEAWSATGNFIPKPGLPSG